MNSEAVIGLANYEIVSIEHSGGAVRISARYSGAIARIATARNSAAKAGVSHLRSP